MPKSLIVLSAALALAGCVRNDVLSATPDSIAIRSNHNPGPVAAAHCAKHGKQPELSGVAMTGNWKQEVYSFVCR